MLDVPCWPPHACLSYLCFKKPSRKNIGLINSIPDIFSFSWLRWLCAICLCSVLDNFHCFLKSRRRNNLLQLFSGIKIIHLCFFQRLVDWSMFLLWLLSWSWRVSSISQDSVWEEVQMLYWVSCWFKEPSEHLELILHIHMLTNPE